MYDQKKVHQRFEQIINEAKNGAFHLNAVEMSFFSKYFGNSIVKADDGNYYLVEKSAIFKFVAGVRKAGLKDLLEEFNLIYEEIAPKIIDGKVLVNAQQLFFKIRNSSVANFQDNKFMKITLLDYEKTIDEIISPSSELVITDEKISTNKKVVAQENTFTVAKKITRDDGAVVMPHGTKGDYTLLYRDGSEEDFIQGESETKSNPMVDAIRELKQLIEVMQTNMLNSSAIQDDSSLKMMETIIISLASSKNNPDDIEKATLLASGAIKNSDDMNHIEETIKDISKIVSTEEIENIQAASLEVNLDAIELLEKHDDVEEISNLGSIVLKDSIPTLDPKNIKNDIDDFFALGDKLETSKRSDFTIDTSLKEIASDPDKLKDFILEIAKVEVDGVGGFYMHNGTYYFSISAFLIALFSKSQIVRKL